MEVKSTALIIQYLVAMAALKKISEYVHESQNPNRHLTVNRQCDMYHTNIFRYCSNNCMLPTSLKTAKSTYKISLGNFVF